MTKVTKPLTVLTPAPVLPMRGPHRLIIRRPLVCFDSESRVSQFFPREFCRRPRLFVFSYTDHFFIANTKAPGPLFALSLGTFWGSFGALLGPFPHRSLTVPVVPFSFPQESPAQSVSVPTVPSPFPFRSLVPPPLRGERGTVSGVNRDRGSG